jgi:hypothetical protein
MECEFVSNVELRCKSAEKLELADFQLHIYS